MDLGYLLRSGLGIPDYWHPYLELQPDFLSGKIARYPFSMEVKADYPGPLNDEGVPIVFWGEGKKASPSPANIILCNVEDKMRLATYRAPSGARRKRQESFAAVGLATAQFGDEILLYGNKKQWDTLKTSVRRGELRLIERAANVKREHLYVVVQNGRLFQHQHPEIPVLLDRGRFLLVEIEPRRVRRLTDKHGTCYALLPLENDMVVFARPDATRARVERVASIQSLVDRVSRQRFEADLIHLASFPTRNSVTPHYARASLWARNQLKPLGYVTRRQKVSVSGRSSWNIMAEKRGNAVSSRKVVVVTAHLDSINQAGGVTSTAPGADDNGSGSAGLLEMARVFHDHNGQHDLRFLLFGGEEQGLFGSKQYVASLSVAEQRKIQAVVNMDMIGALNTTLRTVLLEGAALSQSVIDGLHEAATTYTQLRVETSLHPFNSDHVPFITANIPAVLTIEGADSTNTHVHSMHDTLQHIHVDLAVEILRMNVAFVAREIG